MHAPVPSFSASAKGNPLALHELPRTVTAADAVGADHLPLTKRLEQSFASRIGDLDVTTRTALNLAALSDSGDLGEVVAATELVVGTATPAFLDPAVSAGLISVDDAVIRFKHPLIRSVDPPATHPDLATDRTPGPGPGGAR